MNFSARVVWLVIACGCALTAGCSQSTSRGDDAGASPVDAFAIDVPGSDAGNPVVDAAGTDAGIDPGIDSGRIDSGGIDSGGIDTGPCGASVPSDGAACSREGLVCEYGADPRPDCRTIATCTGGHFVVAPAVCPPPPIDTCPATREAAAGQLCTVAGAYCAYGALSCQCTDCPRGAPICGGPGGALRWDCDVPNADPTCPEAMPARGSACALGGQRCVYACGDGGARVCMGSVWVADRGDECPVSTRRLKRDIHYLAPDEIEALADEARAMRLATYEYTDPALAGPRHLGFIIEDQSDPSYSVEASRARVDLYGYTSLVLATVQSQERRIESLERELAALRAARECDQTADR